MDTMGEKQDTENKGVYQRKADIGQELICGGTDDTNELLRTGSQGDLLHFGGVKRMDFHNTIFDELDRAQREVAEDGLGYLESTVLELEEVVVRALDDGLLLGGHLPHPQLARRLSRTRSYAALGVGLDLHRGLEAVASRQLFHLVLEVLVERGRLAGSYQFLRFLEGRLHGDWLTLLVNWSWRVEQGL